MFGGADLGSVYANVDLKTGKLATGIAKVKGMMTGLDRSMVASTSKMGGAQAGLTNLGAKLQNLGAVGGKATGPLARLGTTLGTLGVAEVGAVAVVGLAVGLTMCVKAAMEAQKVTAETNAIIKTTGGVANVTTAEIQKLSTAIMMKTGYDDEAVQSGANMMLTFRNVRNEVGKGNDIFDQSLPLVADLARKMGLDMPQAALKLGKALQDPVKGLLNLRRFGVMFTDSQEAMIKKLMATGDILGAQKIILAEVKGEMGGVAEAYGKTLPGQIDIAKGAFENLMETLGMQVIPTLTSDVQALVGAIKLLGAIKIPEILGMLAKPVLAGWFFPVIGQFKMVYDISKGLYNTIKEIGKQKVEVDAKGAIKDLRDLDNVGTLAGRHLGLIDTKVHVDTTAAQENVKNLDEQIAELDASLKELTAESTGMGKKLEAELAMTGLAGVTDDVMTSMIESMRDASAGVRDVGYGMMEDLINFFARSSPALQQSGSDIMTDLKNGLEAAADAGPISAQTIKTIIDGLVQKYPELKEVADKLGAIITAGLNSADPSGVLNKLQRVTAAAILAAANIAAAFGQASKNVGGGETEKPGVGGGRAITGMTDMVGNLQKAWEKMLTTVSGIDLRTWGEQNLQYLNKSFNEASDAIYSVTLSYSGMNEEMSRAAQTNFANLNVQLVGANAHLNEMDAALKASEAKCSAWQRQIDLNSDAVARFQHANEIAQESINRLSSIKITGEQAADDKSFATTQAINKLKLGILQAEQGHDYALAAKLKRQETELEKQKEIDDLVASTTYDPQRREIEAALDPLHDQSETIQNILSGIRDQEGVLRANNDQIRILNDQNWNLEQTIIAEKDAVYAMRLEYDTAVLNVKNLETAINEMGANAVARWNEITAAIDKANAAAGGSAGGGPATYQTGGPVGPGGGTVEYGEFVLSKPMLKAMGGAPRMSPVNVNYSGGDTVVHSHTYLNGREIAHDVSREIGRTASAYQRSGGGY